jgi:hypothetical protein
MLAARFGGLNWRLLPDSDAPAKDIQTAFLLSGFDGWSARYRRKNESHS